MVSRMLGAAPTIADAIIDQLARPTDKATAAGELTAARPDGCCTIMWLLYSQVETRLQI